MFLPLTTTKWVGSVFLVAFVMVGCGSSGGSESVIVREADYGEQWPLTVPQAELFCKGYYSIFVKVGDIRYGVNGTGKNYVMENFPSNNRELEDIWRPDPRGIVPRVNITPLINAGEELCDNQSR